MSENNAVGVFLAKELHFLYFNEVCPQAHSKEAKHIAVSSYNRILQFSNFLVSEIII